MLELIESLRIVTENIKNWSEDKFVKKTDSPSSEFIFVDNIEECVDTNKRYVLPDGYIYAYRYKEGEIVKQYVNKIPLATDAADNIYGGDYNADGVNDGYQESVRIGSDGADRTPAEGYYSTGFIRCTTEDSLYFANCEISTTDTANAYQAISCYSDAKAYVGTRYVNNAAQMSGKDYDVDASGNLIRYNCSDLWATTGFVRITGNHIGPDSIITVSEEIKEVQSEGSYQWVNTGELYASDTSAKFRELEQRIDTQDGKIASVEESVFDFKSAYEVPDYIKEEASTVADKIIATRNANSLVLLMASDIHWIAAEHENYANNNAAIKHLGMGMAELRKHTKPDAVALLGDYVYDVTPLDKVQAKKAMKNVIESLYEATNGALSIWLDGNHDHYKTSGDHRLTDGENYALVGANNSKDIEVDADNLTRNYGYVDFKKQRIRLIYLNTTDISGGIESANYISKTQYQWFVDTALDLSDKEDEVKWGIIVCSHFPIYSEQISTGIKIFSEFEKIVCAYKDKSSGTVNGISYNFTSSSAELIATFHGHIHNFKVTDIATDGGNVVKAICIPNGCPDRENPYDGVFKEVDAAGQEVSYPKTPDTAQDTSFSAVTINRDTKTIYAHCYGAGYDREIKY